MESITLNFTKAELDIMREVMFEHKIALKKQRNETSDRDEIALINDKIFEIENYILPKLGNC